MSLQLPGAAPAAGGVLAGGIVHIVHPAPTAGAETTLETEAAGARWDCLIWMSSIYIFSLSHLYHVEMLHYLGVRNYPSAALFLFYISSWL